jgi:hypothetical protein
VRLQVAFALLSIFSKQKYQDQVTVRGNRMGTQNDDKLVTQEVQAVKVEQKKKQGKRRTGQ